MEWPKDGDGARWLPEQRRVYLQGIGQVKVHVHRPVVGRVKTIQIKRQGRRWMLVLSCDEVPTNALPATGQEVGVDVGIVRFATLSDGAGVENPRWGRMSADRLVAAQQRLARANRRSRNRDRKRETVAARHRKIANQRKDFHHKQARILVERYDLLVVEDLQIANMLRRAKPVPDPDNPGQYCTTEPGLSPGSTGVSVTLAGASSSRFCAPKRKMLGAPGSKSTPATPPTAAKTAVTQHRPTASHKRTSPASDARIAPRQTNTPHATSCGLDWPFMPKRPEKNPEAYVGEAMTRR